GSAQRSVTVDDNETAALTLSAPASAMEGTANLQGLVTVGAPGDVNVAVTLSSSNAAEISVPATVTIAVGQTSATFPIAIVDDNRIDGTVTTTITAQVANWTAGSAVIAVSDNESANLTLSAPANLREGDSGKTGTVSLSGTLASNLVVSLKSNDTSEIVVPESVTILAGQTAATFPLTVVGDADAGGAQD